MEMGLGALLTLALVGCGAGSHAVADDDDIGGSDGDADADADVDGDADADMDADSDVDVVEEDSRPSDAPSARDWIDSDPSSVDGEPCCELVGDPLVIDGPADGAGPPLVAWTGEVWGVIWRPVVYRALSPDGAPLGDVVQVVSSSSAYGLAWGIDRFGVAGNQRGFRVHGAEVFMMSAEGDVLAGPTALGREGADVDAPDIDRLAVGYGWIAAYAYYADDGRAEVGAVHVEDDATLAGDEQVLGTGFDARAVGLRTRASVVWLDDEGISHRSVRWSNPGDGSTLRVLEMPTYEDARIEATAYRDHTVVVAMDGAEVWVAFVDPWEDAIAAGPSVVGASGISDRRPGVAAVSERGYVGLCYEEGMGPGGGSDGEDGARFLIVGPDATAWGEELVIVEGLRNIGGCAVAWSGEEFLVAWWEAALDDNRLLVQRIAPRL